MTLSRLADGGSEPSGPHAFGPLVAELFADDPHVPGSVDRVLAERMLRVHRSNAASHYAAPVIPPASRADRPALVALNKRVLGDAYHDVQIAVALTRHVFGHVRRDEPPPLCGGAEEAIVDRGSGLAAELARVLCTLAQLSGLAARMVFLARPEPPARHTVTELFVNGRWSVFDAFGGRFYTWPKHGYASAWDIHELPGLIDTKPDHGKERYVDSAYYRLVAVAEYRLEDAPSFTYTVNPLPSDVAQRLRNGFGA